MRYTAHHYQVLALKVKNLLTAFLSTLIKSVYTYVFSYLTTYMDKYSQWLQLQIYLQL